MGHNKNTCILEHRQLDEVVESQDQQLRQLTQELASQKMSKLPVKRNMSFKEVLPYAKLHEISIGTSSGAPRAIQTPPPMFGQYQQSQIIAPKANIRAPAPFVGGSFIQSIDRCISKSCTSSKSVTVEGGKKFVSMASLSSKPDFKVTSMNTKDKGKGKEHQK